MKNIGLIGLLFVISSAGLASFVQERANFQRYLAEKDIADLDFFAAVDLPDSFFEKENFHIDHEFCSYDWFSLSLFVLLHHRDDDRFVDQILSSEAFKSKVSLFIVSPTEEYPDQKKVLDLDLERVNFLYIFGYFLTQGKEGKDEKIFRILDRLIEAQFAIISSFENPHTKADLMAGALEFFEVEAENEFSLFSLFKLFLMNLDLPSDSEDLLVAHLTRLINSDPERSLHAEETRLHEHVYLYFLLVGRQDLARLYKAGARAHKKAGLRKGMPSGTIKNIRI